MHTRYIHTSKSTWEITDLLQTIFIMELLQPSKSLWISSPWISDITIIDNRSNQFVTIEPEWANRQVSFSEVLAKLIQLGTRIIVGLKDDTHNRAFVTALNNKVGVSTQLKIIQRNLLHAKGLLGDRFYLSGSMNFTFSGISLNEESVQFVTTPEEVALNRVSFIDKWGCLE